MREIKFRVWYPHDESRMEYQDNKTPDWVGDILTDSYHYIFMQYTGLKDKNGKEIYEGDIVKGIFYDGKPEISPVKWFEKGAMFVWFGYPMNIHGLINPEIIGNIYENPELLNEEKVTSENSR